MQAPKFLQFFTDKEQREHFWYYYKGHVAVVLFILILLTMTIVDMVNNSRAAFQVTYVNIPSALEEEWTQHFSDNFPFGSERKLVTESLVASDAIGLTELEAAVNRVCVQVSAGEIDVFVADQDTFRQFAVGELFEDLKTCFPEDFLNGAADNLYYSNVGGEQCITGLIWRRPSNGQTYVFAIPYSSALKESAAELIQSLFTEGAFQ